MSITAIVPVWNGRQLLERLLASLEAQTEPTPLRSLSGAITQTRPTRLIALANAHRPLESMPSSLVTRIFIFVFLVWY